MADKQDTLRASPATPEGFAAGIEAAAQWHDSDAERIRLLALEPNTDAGQRRRYEDAQDDHISHAAFIRSLIPTSAGEAKPYAFARPLGGPQPVLLAHQLNGRLDRHEYSIPLYAHPAPAVLDAAPSDTGWIDEVLRLVQGVHEEYATARDQEPSHGIEAAEAQGGVLATSEVKRRLADRFLPKEANTTAPIPQGDM